MYTHKTFSQDVAKELQLTADNLMQLEQRLNDSCGRCYKQPYCIKEYCKVWKAHEKRKVYLEAKEREQKGSNGKTIWVTTRKYNISPLNQKVRSALQMMAAARKHIMEYSSEEYANIITYQTLLEHRDYAVLKGMMVKNGHFKKGRQKVTAITPIVNKLKEIIKEVF